MSDDGVDDRQRERKRRRGPFYKQYLEPDQPLTIPDSTLRSRAKINQKREEQQHVSAEAGAGIHQQVIFGSGHVEISHDGSPTPNDGPPCQRGGESNTIPLELMEPDGQKLCNQRSTFGHVSDETNVPSEESTAPESEGEDDALSSSSESSTHEFLHESSTPDDIIGPSEINIALEADQEEDEVHPLGCECGRCAGSEDLETRSVPRKESYNWDEPIHPAVTTSRFEVFLMLFHIFIRHNMTYALVEDILKFLNVIFGSAILKTSEYIFRKLFKPKCKILHHFYCTHCQTYLGEKTKLEMHGSSVLCDCGHDYNLKKIDGNHFFTISISDLLKYLFQRPNVKLVSQTGENGMYCDVINGNLYKENILPEIREGKKCLTLTFNTDGAKVFKSNKGSIWPIQFIVNEIDAKDRFRDENVFLCGIWYGKAAPNMTAFLKPLVDELVFLAEHGVEVVTSDGSRILYHVYAPICSVDSGAKPKILNMKGHNGSHGCGYCLHPNLPVPGFPSNQLRYITKEGGNLLDFQYRTHRTMVTDMLQADNLDRQGNLRKRNVGTPDETQDHVQGLYGISITAGIPKFDVVNSFIIDYLHTILLGVMGSLIRFWFDSNDHKDPPNHDPVSELSKIDSRLSSIKPPQAMTTRCKIMSERSDWKGKELRSFVLFYGLPCLKDLRKFSDKHFKHFQKFVISLQILLGSAITQEQINYVERILVEFVNDFEELYGNIHMTLNIHLVTHVCHIVRQWGPLWCYSNFCFESGNGRLSRLVQGTKGVMSQIGQKYLSVLSASDFIRDYNVSESVLQFCSDVINHSYNKKSAKFSSVTVLGAENIVLPSEVERAAFAKVGYDLDQNTYITYYNRIILDGVVFYSKAYDKPQAFDDTCVKLCNGTFAVTQKFVKLTDVTDILVLVNPIRISTAEKLAPLTHTGAFHFLAPFEVINVKEIVAKCVRIQFEDKNYVCEIPNNFERD